MVNIFEVLNARKTTKLSISNIEKEIVSDGSGFVYYRLILSEQLDEVEGKSKYWNIQNEKSETLWAYDVMEVLVREDVMKLHHDDISKDLTIVDGIITGKYEGDLFLDVSETQKVWLDFITLGARRKVAKDENRAKKFRRPGSTL